jgi:hypothetical protein
MKHLEREDTSFDNLLYKILKMTIFTKKQAFET